jgi:hypothetical protein
MQGVMLFFFLVLFLFSFSTRTIVNGLLAEWYLFVPALAGMMMFALVLVEWRYVAAFVVVFWLGLLCAIRLPQSHAAEKIAGYLCIALVIMLTTKYLSSNYDEALSVAVEALNGREAEIHSQWQVSEELRQIGVRPGDKVAYIGNSTRAYWARLGRFRIIAEIHGDEEKKFWRALPATQLRAIRSLFGAGAKMIVCDSVPEFASVGRWKRLGDTKAHVYVFDPKI